MNHQLSDLDTEPWYKQLWPWILITIPLLTVIAGIITVKIAYDSNDSLVKDNYYKEGLAINSQMQQVEQAKDNAMVAYIKINAESDLIQVDLRSNKKLPNQLQLSFSHPTLKSKDQIFILESLSGNDFVAHYDFLDTANWYVTLDAPSKTWLLKSRWRYPNKRSIIIEAK